MYNLFFTAISDKHFLSQSQSDEGGWFQLLIFVIVAVLYALSGLARARKRKRAVTDDDEVVPVPPRSPDMSMHRLPVSSSYQQSSSIPMPMQTHPMDRIDANSPSASMPIATISQSTPLEIHRPVASESRHNTAPKAKTASKTVSKPHSWRLAQNSLDFTDPTVLQQAIIHYEILGPCIALRDSSEHLGLHT